MGQDREGNNWIIRWCDKLESWVGATLLVHHRTGIFPEIQFRDKLRDTIIRHWICPHPPDEKEIADLDAMANPEPGGSMH